MNLEETIKIFYSNEQTEDVDVVKIHENIEDLDDQDVNKIIEAVLYFLWKLSKWKNQVKFVDDVIKSSSQNIKILYLKKICRTWEKIETDRKDKYYYFVEKILRTIEITQDNVDFFITLASSLSLKSFFIRIILEVSHDLESYFVDFISYCNPSLLYLFKDMKADVQQVKKYLNDRSIKEHNRKTLCALIKNK